ncbi:MAG: hypothetical protein ABI995_10740 [Acidobacteriota bacterium]
MERGNGTHQDRIRTHEAGNQFLQGEYLPDHNARFARAPTRPQDYHRRAPRASELAQVFCLEGEPSISNDWVVRYENRYLQLERHSDYPPRQAKATVQEWEEGRIEIRYQGKVRRYREIAAPEPPAAKLVTKPPRRSGWETVGQPSVEGSRAGRDVDEYTGGRFYRAKLGDISNMG